MKLKTNQSRYLRRKTDLEAWERTIDALARKLCPLEERLAYEKKLQLLTAKSRVTRKGAQAEIYVFPVWRRYRQKALQVATIHRAAPFLRRLPLTFSCLLGDLLFK